MSKNRRNNHYHYAEKFTDRSRSKKSKSRMCLPRRAVFFAVLVLLLFGVISITFSHDIGADPSEDQGGSIIVSVRNAKTNRDLALTGAISDLASTGTVGGGYLYVEKPSTWNRVAIMTGNWSGEGYDNNENHDNSSVQYLTRVGNSNIYYANLNSVDGVWGFAIVDPTNDNWGHENTHLDSRKTGCTHYTDNSTWSLNSGYYYVASISGSSNPYTLTMNNSSANAIATNYSFNQTYKMQYKVGSGSYTDASSDYTPGIASLSTSFWNTDYHGGGTSTKNIAYNDYTYERGVKTATVTLTASAGTGFDLVGIYKDGSSTKLNSGTTYTISGANTYYARFSAKSYSINYVLTNGNGTDAVAGNASWKSGYTAPTSRYYTQSVTLPTSSNVEASGRKFEGWYENASCTGTKVTSVPADRSSDITLYAKWTWDTFSINYNKGSGSPVTGTISGTVPNGTKTYNVDYSITNSTYSRPGFTQAGWSSAGANQTTVEYGAGDTYSANSDLTLYPVWTLNNPTATLTGGNMVAGSASGVNLNPAISPPQSDISQQVTYNITGPIGNNATVTASNGTAATATSAIFKTDTPGTYTVEAVVVNTASTGVTNANSQASVTSSAVTINVQPIAPTFTFTVNGAANASAAGTAADPFIISLGSDYDFTGTVGSPVSGYTYEWSTDSQFATILGTGTTITFNDNHPHGVMGVTQDYAPTPANTQCGDITITLYCRALCNGQYNSGGSKSNVYKIQPLVEEFDFLPYQKIYKNDDGSVSLTAAYRMNTPQGYTTNLLFSPDNDFINNKVTADTVSNQFLNSFLEPIRRYLFPNGPKYFYINVSAEINHRQISSDSSVAHTTVGTADSSATKPIYFYNKTSLELSNYQVMCYWIDPTLEGDYGYQIAQDLNKDDENSDGFTYRVNIPATATHVQFALVRKDENQLYHYYGTPVFSNNIFTFNAPHYAGATNLVALTDSTRVIQTGNNYTTSTETVGTTDYTQYGFTCTVSAFLTN